MKTAIEELIEFARNVNYNDSRFSPKNINALCDELEKGAEPMTHAETVSLDHVLQYLWSDEQKDFIGEGKPKVHIFRDLELLEEYLHARHEK